MERRNLIGLIGISSLLAVQNVFPSNPIPGKTTANGDFMKAFMPRWEGLQTHAFEVLEAMPEAQFDFQPTKEVMSFSSLFSHIGRSLEVYAGMLDGTAAEEEPKNCYQSRSADIHKGILRSV